MRWLLPPIAWLRRKIISMRQWMFDGIVPPYRTVVVEANLPAKLRARTLYIVQEDDFKEQAAMLCPCGRNHVLHMNLLPDERPKWRVTQHPDGSASLHPSVWRKKDCRSHFWFRHGRVVWVRTKR